MAPPVSNNLGISYLTATVGNPIMEGQVRAGYAATSEIE